MLHWNVVSGEASNYSVSHCPHSALWLAVSQQPSDRRERCQGWMTHRSTYNYITIHANECKLTYTHTVNREATNAYWQPCRHWGTVVAPSIYFATGTSQETVHKCTWVKWKNHLAHAVLIHIPDLLDIAVHCIFPVIITFLLVFLLCVFSQ